MTGRPTGANSGARWVESGGQALLWLCSSWGVPSALCTRVGVPAPEQGRLQLAPTSATSPCVALGRGLGLHVFICEVG